MAKMTAGKLAKLLSEVPPNTPIVLSGDSEGNYYNVLSEFGIGGLMKAREVEIDLPDSKDIFVLYPD